MQNSIIYATRKNILVEAENTIIAQEAKIAEYEQLKDPHVLHVNLLRGFPAKLSEERLLHLLGSENALNQQIAKLKAENARLTEWIGQEGLNANVCTRNILGKICANCNCGKKQLTHF